MAVRWRDCAIALAVPGFAGGMNQSHAFCSFDRPFTSPAHASSTASFCELPLPKFVGESQSLTGAKPGAVASPGARGGSVVIEAPVPSGPVFGPKQLPAFDGNSSHQKSTPLGIGWPLGDRPMELSW